MLTSYLTLCFKFIQKHHIPAFQAILFNYWTCVITGSFVNGGLPISSTTFYEPSFKYALLMGFMFISIFNIVGFTAQKIGVAVASVGNKLSLVIPFIFSVYLYHDQINLFKIMGIVIALLAVVLTCWPATVSSTEPAPNRIPLSLLVLVPSVLFFSSGLLDTLIKFVEHRFLNETNHNAFLIRSFAVAGTIGTLMLILFLLMGKQKFSYKAIIAGICIGVPNYFSIWCLLKVLKANEGNSSAVIPINNMGIVLFSSIMAMLIFKEKLSTLNWTGILLSICAIALIAYA